MHDDCKHNSFAKPASGRNTRLSTWRAQRSANCCGASPTYSNPEALAAMAAELSETMRKVLPITAPEGRSIMLAIHFDRKG